MPVVAAVQTTEGGRLFLAEALFQPRLADGLPEGLGGGDGHEDSLDRLALNLHGL